MVLLRPIYHHDGMKTVYFIKDIVKILSDANVKLKVASHEKFPRQLSLIVSILLLKEINNSIKLVK